VIRGAVPSDVEFVVGVATDGGYQEFRVHATTKLRAAAKVITLTGATGIVIHGRPKVRLFGEEVENDTD